MTRLIALVIFAGSVLTSCAGRNVGDYVPVWAGGIPSNAPPRPGSPEYDTYRQQLEGEAARDKSKDPPRPKTDAGSALIMPSQTPANPPVR
jgi:hypothetical protein